MSKLFGIAGLLTLCALLLAVCASSPAPVPLPPNPNNPDNPTNPPPANGACAVVLTEDITVSSRMVNSPAACDYLVTNQVVVENGTLTIDPGVVVQFEQDARLRISDNARLVAVGTPDQRIRFEARASVQGYAYGLYFTSPLESRLENVDLVNLGKEDTGLLAGHDAAIDGGLDAELALQNVRVSGSIFDGMNLEDINLTAFNNVQLFNNARYGLVIDAAQAGKLDTASDYLGNAQTNGRPYILLEGVSSDERLYADAVWQALNTPYFIDIAVYIEGGMLILEAGTTLVMNAGASFNVRDAAALVARGVLDNPVVFTGEQQPGYWDGLSFFESDS